jgi:hypothetical protein
MVNGCSFKNMLERIAQHPKSGVGRAEARSMTFPLGTKPFTVRSRIIEGTKGKSFSIGLVPVSLNIKFNDHRNLVTRA